MKLDEFWALIEQHIEREGDELHVEALESALAQLPLAEIVDFDKIFHFLKIKGEAIETEFYVARNQFMDNVDIYKKFIEDCRINDNAWKDSFLLRIKELHGLFSSSKQLEEEMKELVNLISQNNVECPNEEKLQNHTMLKVLITHKMFLMDILKADFEQRFDYLDIKELPFE